MPTLDLYLDTVKPAEETPRLITRQGDTGTTVKAHIYEDGTEYDFTGKYLELDVVRPDGSWVKVTDACEHIGQTNAWNIKLPVDVTALAGLCGLCYFTVKGKDDPDFRDTTSTFQLLLLESGTAQANVAPYSDQVDRLIQTVASLVVASQQQQAEQADQFAEALEAINKSYQASEEERNTLSERAETARQEAFDAAEAERKRIYDAAVKLLNEGLENIDAINAFYLEANWKDTETGFVSTEKFNGYKEEANDTFLHADQGDVEGGYAKYVAYLDDRGFRETVAGGWPTYE